MKKQLEGLVQIAAIQGVNGQSNPRLLKEGNRVAEELRFCCTRRKEPCPWPFTKSLHGFSPDCKTP